jgi:hypothetical protein
MLCSQPPVPDGQIFLRNFVGAAGVVARMNPHRRLAPGVVALAMLAITASGAEAHPIADLFSSSRATEAAFNSVAVSGSTVVAGGLVTNVFVEPAEGWVTGGPSAVLTDPTLNGDAASSVSIDANTIVASMDDGSGAEDVFVAPVISDWSGNVIPAARLVDDTGQAVSGGVIDGDTVAAFSSAHDAVDIFREPTGGWTGTVVPAAHLALPSGVTALSDLAFSDGAVFVPTQRVTYVFQEPIGGWAGTVSPSAALDATGDVSANGSTALVDGLLFNQPPAGWSGRLTPDGAVAPRPVDPAGGFPYSREVLSGGYAVTARLHDPDGGCDDNHVCRVTMRAASEPASGWSGSELTDPLTGDQSDGDPLALAIAGQDLFQTNGDEIEIIPLPASVGSRLTAPTGLPAHVTGLTGGMPSLRFGVRSGGAQPSITRLTVIPPRGLSFTTRPGLLAHGVTLQGAQTRRSVSDGVLTLTNPGRRQLLRVSIGGGALTLSPALARRLRGLAAHHRHLSLRVIVRATTAVAQWNVVFTLRA